MDGKKKLEELVTAAKSYSLPRADFIPVSAKAIRSISDAYKAMERENERLRKIVSECATALGNGACVGPDCTIEFMSELPREIALHVATLRQTTRKEALEEAASELDKEGPAGNSQWDKGCRAGCELSASVLRTLAQDTTGQEGGR